MRPGTTTKHLWPPRAPALVLVSALVLTACGSKSAAASQSPSTGAVYKFGVVGNRFTMATKPVSAGIRLAQVSSTTQNVAGLQGGRRS
jgi:hypothetical protein